MKRITLVLSLILQIQFSYSQEIELIRGIGGSFNESAMNLAVDFSGNKYIAWGFSDSISIPTINGVREAELFPI